MGRFFAFMIVLFAAVGSANGQSNVPERDPFRDQNGNTWHQFHLDFPAIEILKMEYINSTEPVDGILSPDGTSILIKNYPGDKSVKVVLKTANGEPQEVSKSKCYIDPVLQYL